MPSKRVVALLCARGGSKGIPMKALVPLYREPLISWSIKTAQQASVHEVWVSTDSPEIKNHCVKMGVRVLDRPAELATDTAGLEGVIEHFSEHVPWDILVLLQITSPLVLPQHINKGITMFMKNLDKYDSAFSVVSMEKNDLLFWSKDTMTPVNYNPKNRGRRQDRGEHYVIETGGFYITTKEQFMESKCRIGKKPMFIDIPYWSSFEVDTMEDLKYIEKILAV